MNPQTPENQPSLDLPPVKKPEVKPSVAPGSKEQATEAPVKALGTERNPELPVQAQSSSGGQGQATLPPVNSPQQGQAVQTAPVQDDDQSPQIADDVDLIEKEWVEKAKKIVESTKEDPHKQNEEITKVKADYIKKRYNKDLPTGKE